MENNWTRLDSMKPDNFTTTAYARYGGTYECERHVKSWLSNGKNVWVGRVNYGSETIEGFEDESGEIVTHFMDYIEPNLPLPPIY